MFSENKDGFFNKWKFWIFGLKKNWLVYFLIYNLFKNGLDIYV